MEILMAADGTLDPSKVAKAVDRCHREGDKVTVVTALPVPVDFLQRPGSSGVNAAADIAHEAGHPIVDVLATRDIDCRAVWRTTENRAAKTISQTIHTHNIDLPVIGSHGGGRFEGLLGSTSTKLVRMAPADVLVIRTAGAA